MDSKEAFDFINRVLSEKGKPILNDVEEGLFLGIWKGEKYEDIAAKLFTNNQYARELGSKLFKKLNEELGIIVSKRNFQNPIKHFYQEYSSNSPPIKTPTQNPIPLPSDNQNPFTPLTGKVDDDKKLFGREKEISEILDFLTNNCNVSPIGEDGIGKSSLLWAICRQTENLSNLKRKLVFIDLNDDIDSPESFYEELFYRIGISGDVGFRKSKKELETKRILLVLDNIYKFSLPEFTSGFRGQIRYLSEGMNAPLKLVVAANQSLPELFRDGENGIHSPLEAIFQQIDILRWNEQTIRDFIKNRLKDKPIKFNDSEIEKLIEQSGGHPQKLTELCYKLYRDKEDFG